MLVEVDSEEKDGGRAKVEAFVQNDPYVQNKLVDNWSVKEFALKGARMEFDRLASEFVLRS